MQKATLCFRDYQNKDLISGITQPSKVGTHQNLNGANDFNGRNAQDQVDLLAPYDCRVMAIATYDNTIFFESTSKVETPIGVYKCWFMCSHMNDNDFKRYGMKVGRTFKQGDPCYTEGNKGIGSGYHIHMEQGTGRFKGGSSPYWKSNDTYYYNGKKYYTYYPQYTGGYEYPVVDMFFLKDVEIVLSSYEKQNGKKYYDGQWKFLPTASHDIPSTGTGNDKTIKEMQDKINDLTKQLKTIEENNDILSKEIKVYKDKMENIKNILTS